MDVHGYLGEPQGYWLLLCPGQSPFTNQLVYPGYMTPVVVEPCWTADNLIDHGDLNPDLTNQLMSQYDNENLKCSYDVGPPNIRFWFLSPSY